MKKTIWQWLVFLSLGLAFLAPRKVFGAGACTCARFNDFYDCGCRKTPSVPGGPPSGAVNASGNSSYCPTCQAAHGMPQWWVDEPYINVHVMDEPLSYTTSSGQELAFRFNYRQRFSVPGLDQVPSQIIPFQAYPNPNRIADDNYVNTMHEAAPNPGSVNAGGMTNATWSHNWMMHIVFWDWNLEASRVGYPGGVGGESYPFQRYYEAFQFDPDGGIRYFTYSYGGFGSAIAGETLNVPTQTTNSVSQAQLVMGNALYFTNRPTPDANGIYWGNGTNGLTVLYPDGSKDVFDLLNWFPLGNTTMDALLTQRIDPQGRATQLGYQAVIITNATMESTTNSYFRVRYVVDTDGRTNTFVYTNSTASPWLLTEIDDPFGRKARFAYNGSNWLSTIIDAANNTNSFAYPSSPDSGGWLQSLTTPYGTTSFSYYQLMDSGNPRGAS
jgi:YD repeat-containing protein